MKTITVNFRTEENPLVSTNVDCVVDSIPRIGEVFSIVFEDKVIATQVSTVIHKSWTKDLYEKHKCNRKYFGMPKHAVIVFGIVIEEKSIKEPEEA